MGEDPKNLEDLLSVITHDLRTPLSVVHTTTSMLMNPKYQLGPAQVREQYERIRRNVDVMNSMLSELTDLSHLRSGKFSVDRQPLAVTDSIQDAAALQEKLAAERGLTISVDTTGAAQVSADRARLLQVLRTLLGHAIRTNSAGSRITIGGKSAGGQVQIDVVSPDLVMTAEDVAQAFDAYGGNGKYQKSGAGLGMFIAKGIVEAHGGTIACTSAPGTGTALSVRLPTAN
jgi:signal transduction histidine kinase